MFKLISRFRKIKHSIANMSTVQLRKFPQPPESHVIIDQLERFSHIMVIGDVHGCYDEMKELFTKANVDLQDERVLKIFVGDLVNKGPKNVQVLDEILKMKSVLSVRGNHDEVVLRETYQLLNDNSFAFKKKNEWMKDLSVRHLTYLKNLPFSISIPDLDSIVVHAGLVPGIDLENQNCHDMITMRNVFKPKGDSTDFKASSKRDQGEPWASVWTGPTHVYFGHDAKRGLQRHSHATGLDTGCVYGRQLSAIFIYGPNKGQFVTVNAKKIYDMPEGKYIPPIDFSTLEI